MAEKRKKRKDGRIEIKTTIDGKRKSFYGRTKQAALEKMRQYREEVEKGPLVSAIADEWEEEYQKKVTPNSYRSVPARVRAAKERFQGKYAKDITPKMVSNYAKALAESGKTKKTVKEYLLILRQIFKKAIIDGDLTDNPAELIQATGKESTPREMPSDSDLDIVERFVDIEFGLFAFLIQCTGLRKGEALGLMFTDIDHKAKTINVVRSVYHIGNRPEAKAPKTKSGIRQIPLLDILDEVLPDCHVGYVFPGKENGLMTETEYKRKWDNYKKESGITCTPHQLRHAMATFCFEADLTEKDAQDILGHADITTTRKIYTHIRESRRKLNADKLNNFMSSKSRRESSKPDSKANA